MAQKKPDTKSPEKTQALVKDDPLQTLTKETVHRYINQMATETEVGQFLHLCSTWSLDPFKREIYLIKYSVKDPATIVMGYEVFLKRAERTGKISGWKHWTEGEPKSKGFKALIEIHRKDWEFPFRHEVYWDEYAQYRASGELNKFWNSKPRTMLLKVADAQGFRLCFPDDLGGMPYTAEEMPKTEEILEAEIVEERPSNEPKEEKSKASDNIPLEKAEEYIETRKEEWAEEKKKPKPKPKPEPKKEEEPVKQGPEVEPTNGQEPEAEDLGGESEEEEEEEELTLTPEDQQPTEMATEDQKKDILSKMKLLVDEYKRDEEDLKKKMAGHLKKAYGTAIRPQEIPGGCDYKEAKNLIVSLDMTINSMKGEKL